MNQEPLIPPAFKVRPDDKGGFRIEISIPAVNGFTEDDAKVVAKKMIESFSEESAQIIKSRILALKKKELAALKTEIASLSKPWKSGAKKPQEASTTRQRLTNEEGADLTKKINDAKAKNQSLEDFQKGIDLKKHPKFKADTIERWWKK